MTSTPAQRQQKLWWIIAAAVVALGLIIWAMVAFAGSPTPVAETPTPSATPSASPSGTPVESPSPTPTETAAGGDDAAPTEEEITHFNQSITVGNTAALEQNFADVVFVVMAATECCGPQSPVQAIDSLQYVQPGSGAMWDFAPSEATLDGYRAGFYAEYFPEHAIVGISSDGYLVSFTRDSDRLVTGMFLAMEELL